MLCGARVFGWLCLALVFSACASGLPEGEEPEIPWTGDTPSPSDMVTPDPDQGPGPVKDPDEGKRPPDAGQMEPDVLVDDRPDTSTFDPDPNPDPGFTYGPVHRCFEDIAGDLAPNYDRYGPTPGSHCMGTNHQNIQGVERVVYLGDSVTVGTPPTDILDFYSVRLLGMLQTRFGNIAVQNCAEWGARTDDLLLGKNELAECFPDGGSNDRTLIVMTIGGNDVANWAQDDLSLAQATQEAETAAQLLRDAIDWIQSPGRFPNGVFVIFANPYEYTDGTGDLSSCPFAPLAGLEDNWLRGAPAVLRFQERFMQIAVETGTDMIFTLEHFCGHGYRRDDPGIQCYRGAGAELWFDLTCIHPSAEGHAKIAEMFMAVIDE